MKISTRKFLAIAVALLSAFGNVAVVCLVNAGDYRYDVFLTFPSAINEDVDEVSGPFQYRR